MDDVGNAVHRDFERNGDLLFDLLGRDARPLGDHVDVVVGYVGIGFHRKIVERNRAPRQQQQRDGQHHETVVQREVDYSANHWIVLRRLAEPHPQRSARGRARSSIVWRIWELSSDDDLVSFDVSYCSTVD